MPSTLPLKQMEAATRDYYDAADAAAVALCQRLGIWPTADLAEAIAFELKGAYHRGANDAVEMARGLIESMLPSPLKEG